MEKTHTEKKTHIHAVINEAIAANVVCERRRTKTKLKRENKKIKPEVKVIFQAANRYKCLLKYSRTTFRQHACN